MRRLFLIFLLHQCVHGSCPNGFVLVRNGECRGLYATVSLRVDVAVNTAVSKCQEIDGNSVIVRDELDNSFWKELSRSTNYGNLLLLGLICNQTTKKWQWVDGSPLDYKPPGFDSQLTDSCVSNLAWFIMPDGGWEKWTTTTSSFDVDIACSTQIPIPSSNGCYNFDDDSDDGVCYEVGEAGESWQDAQMSCRKLGANLASIHNDKENAFVRRLAASKGTLNGLFLGASISGKGNDFSWIDGSNWDYVNFFPGFPRPDFGECLAMDTTTAAGQWMNMDCSSKLPVACIRDRLEVQPNFTCKTETWKEGSIVFPSTHRPNATSLLKWMMGRKWHLR